MTEPAAPAPQPGTPARPQPSPDSIAPPMPLGGHERPRAAARGQQMAQGDDAAEEDGTQNPPPVAPADTRPSPENVT